MMAYWKEIVMLSLPFAVCLFAAVSIYFDKYETGD